MEKIVLIGLHRAIGRPKYSPEANLNLWLPLCTYNIYTRVTEGRSQAAKPARLLRTLPFSRTLQLFAAPQHCTGVTGGYRQPVCVHLMHSAIFTLRAAGCHCLPPTGRRRPGKKDCHFFLQYRYKNHRRKTASTWRRQQKF